ncbi:MAG: fibronectin type III domain-containing protein [Quadrisphaera sp.]
MRSWSRAAVAAAVAVLTGIGALPASASPGTAPAPAQHGAGALRPTTTVYPTQPRFPQRTALPASVDLTAWAVPVGDQGGVNSCVAWATGYGLQGWEAKRAGREADIFAPMYMYSQIKIGQDGGAYPEQGAALLVSQGIDTWAHYSQGNYTLGAPPDDSERANAALFQATGYTSLYSGVVGDAAVTAIKQALASQHPVGLSFDIYPAFDHLSTADDHLSAAEVQGATPRGGHEVQVLGYDSTGVLIQNSWGTAWGDRGRAWLDWDFVSQYSYQAVVLSGIEAAPTKATAPGAPTGASATRPSGTSATLAWSTPTSDGGSTITGYRVSRDGKDSTGTGAWSTVVGAGTKTFTFGSLVAGSSYTLSVTAINAVGESPAASVKVGGSSGLPSAATSVSASATTTAATLTWAPPASNGGSAITGYLVGRDGKDASGTGAWSTTVSASQTSQSFANLLPATTYTLSVTPITARGKGPATTVKATTGSTSAPQAVKATVSGTSATLRWSAPAAASGAVTGYRVGRNGYDGSGTGPWSTTTPASATSLTFLNLKRGATYVLSVAAVTAQGTGTAATVTVSVPA